MPRTGRGGSRQGAPGTAYGNRTDLNVAKPIPVATATGQQYGQATDQRQAQQAVPMGAPPSPALQPAASPGAPAPAPGPLPGQVTPLDAPTQRPGEPITAGMPIGAGAGPEGLAVNLPGQGYQSAKDFLTSQVAGANSPEIAFLLAQLQARGL